MKHAFTALLFLAALALYQLGFSTGAVMAFVGGAALEIWFWIRWFRACDAAQARQTAELQRGDGR